MSAVATLQAYVEQHFLELQDSQRAPAPSLPP